MPKNLKSLSSPLATPSATKRVLERHGFTTKKAFGQNFLVNDAIIGKILDLAEVGAGDDILEIGPGIGTLTIALLARARQVVAIERDPALPAVLADTLSEYWSRFVLIEGDAVDVIARGLQGAGERVNPNKLVSNLPYAVAATVVLDCFERIGSLASATVMVQREVAERMCATPRTKAYGAYTVKLALYAETRGMFPVGPQNFMPPPHVESMVIRLDRREDAEDQAEIQAACVMADAAFFARRKTIANSCKQYFSARDPELASLVSAVLAQAEIDPQTRGETLSPDDYMRLGRAFLGIKAKRAHT